MVNFSVFALFLKILQLTLFLFIKNWIFMCVLKVKSIALNLMSVLVLNCEKI